MFRLTNKLVKFNSFISVLIWVVIVGIITIFSMVVYNFSCNFPFYDDFDNLIIFISRYINSDGILGKISLLFEQNFEHRVLFAKFLTLSYYEITGGLNIKNLIILGDLSLIGIFSFFVLLKVDNKISILSLFAVACTLFQFQHYEDSISWATCSLQHAPCIFFTLCSFYITIFQKKYIAGAILALIALFTSANGIMAIFVWLIIFHASGKLSTKGIVGSTLVISATIIHLLTLKIHSGSVLLNASSNFIPKCTLLISFAGQLADSNVFGTDVPSIILGILVLSPITIAIWKFANKRLCDISPLQWFCLSGLVSVLFVGFLITFARGTTVDHLGYKMDRYKIYSVFFVVFAIVFYDKYWSYFSGGYILRIAVSVLAFSFCLSSYYIYYGEMISYRNKIRANQMNYEWSKSTYFPVIFKNEISDKEFEYCRRTFLVPAKDPMQNMIDTIQWKRVAKDLRVSKTEDNYCYGLKNANFIIPSGFSELFVIATEVGSNQPRYIFPIEYVYERSIRSFCRTLRKVPRDGFETSIRKQKINTGYYKLRLLCLVDNKIHDIYNIGEMKIF